MGFIDDVAVNVKSAAEVVGQKAEDIYDKSKLALTATEIKAEIRKKYTQLGKKVYELSKDGKTDLVGVEQELSEIENLHIQLDNVNKARAKAD